MVSYRVNYISSITGSSILSGQTVYYNTTYTFPTPPTYAGYTFYGWYDNSYLTGTQYSSGSQITWLYYQDKAFYAYYAENKYSISYFDGDNIYSDLSPKTIYFNSTYTFPTPTKTGYTFNGWYNNVYLSGNIFSGGTKITWTYILNQRFYAKFTANTYTITYYDNETVLSSSSATYNTTYSFTSAPKEGYTFNGWYENSNLTGTVYFSNSLITWTFAENKSFYAKFIEKSYSLTYNLDGGTLTGQPSSAIYNSYYSIPSPTKTNYTFNGWYIDSDFRTPISSSGTWTLTSNQILYAKFTINAGYDLTYNTNGIGGTSKTYNTVIFESTPIIPIPKAVGYTFNGWYDSISGGTKKINNDGTGVYTMPAATTTLYAQWTVKSNVRLSDLRDTYPNISVINNRILMSAYQSSISKAASSRTALKADFIGKGPDL
jgi:uncharacterized repeat protein (TIGR02543 family)